MEEEKTTKAKGLREAERIAAAGMVLLGKDYHRAAFLLCHPRTKTTNENALHVAVSRWINSPEMKKFRATMQELIETGAISEKDKKKPGRPKKEITNDLTTREGIVQQLISATSYTEGKDSVSALQTLAKLQGYDKPDAKEQDERRSYFLPWVSHCRSCRLMKSYQNAMQAAGLAPGVTQSDTFNSPDGEDQEPATLQDQPGR